VRRRLFRPAAPRAGLGALALAPLVDLLTLLLVAVLRTWSTDPPVSISEAGFTLPVSREERPAPQGVTVDVGPDGLYVQGWRVGSSVYHATAEGAVIPEVVEALQANRATQVLIRADRAAPWSVLGKVLVSAQQAGASDIDLVAVSRASL